MKVFARLSFVAILVVESTALSQPYSIKSFTLACGGGRSTSSRFEVSGTVGQFDASQDIEPMSGSIFEASGGFWPDVSTACACPGDMNGDHNRDGRDIQQFADCFVAGSDCACANANYDNGIDFEDVAVFVSFLLSDSSCP